jgi:hypothetical protein
MLLLQWQRYGKAELWIKNEELRMKNSEPYSGQAVCAVFLVD